MTTDVHPGPLEPAAEAPAAAKKTPREKRWERRRRRIWFEEALAWVLVPVIVVGFYVLVESILGALGTSVSAIAEGIRLIVSNL
jgi:hypothetical protein